MFACFCVLGRARSCACSRTGCTVPAPAPLGSVACRRAAWHHATAVGVLRDTSGAGRCWSWEEAQLVPKGPPDPPQGPAFAWELACGSPHHAAPEGHRGWWRLGAGAVPASCLPSPQTQILLPCACTPSGTPFCPGGHRCPQCPEQRAAFGHCFHPNPRTWCHQVPPDARPPQPAPSLPSPASLGMAPCARAAGVGSEVVQGPGSRALGSQCANCVA